MEWIDAVEVMRQRTTDWKSSGKRVALIPTLGALHAGHQAAIEKGRELADHVVVSIFVDPEEFGANEDYQQFPRTPEADREVCEGLGVDAVFAPAESAIYPQRASTYVLENHVSSGLCGVSRPNHFRGVATTFVKLFQILGPQVVVYPEHQIQRIAVLRRVVENLFLPVEVETVPLVRESDGLAADARNRYLNPDQRRDAAKIYAALKAGMRVYEGGNTSVDRIEAEVINVMRETRRLHVLYAMIVDRYTMQDMREIVPGRSTLVTAVLIDQIRLLDHIEF
jgi:pantoate--beta-alanine ligase